MQTMSEKIVLSRLLTPAHILWRPDCHSKKRVFEQISILLENIGGLSRETLFRGLIQRERLGTTALGNQGAIPHIRMPGMETPLCALAHLQKPIQYDADDDSNSAVRTMFFLIAPENANETHLHLLAIFSEMLCDDEFMQGLDNCADADAAHRHIADWEQKKAAEIGGIFSPE